MKYHFFKNFNWDLVKLTGNEGENIEKEDVIDFLDFNKRILLFVGETGVGKTHLAKATRNKFLDDCDERNEKNEIISADDLYDVFFNAQSFLDDTEARYILRDIMRTQLLIIDDLGDEKQTEKGVFNSGFKKILDAYINKIVITSNLSLKDIRERYGEKIFSRLMESVQVVVIEAKDYRLYKEK